MHNVDELHIRDLAKQVKELSQKPEKRDVIRRYTDINSLIPSLPPILIFLPAAATRDLFTLEQVKVSDPFLQGLERGFLYRLQREDKVGDDWPVTDIVYTGFQMRVTNWMDGYKRVIIGENLESSCFQPCILEYEDFHKLRVPELSCDAAATEEEFNRMNDLLGDILTVKKGSPYSSVCGWGDSMIDQLVEMRGLTQIYYDMADRPEAIHGAMEFMTQGHLALLDRFREQNLLALNNGENMIGSSSLGFCAELPGPDFDPEHIVERNLWGFAQAQELSEVSPDMLEEFVLPYQARILNRFGLSDYGCCEAMEHKIDLVERYVKNLRMVSISPFTNPEIAAEKCRGKYVYAWKPQPSHMIDFNERALEADLRRTLQATHGCCLTINLEDVFNYGGKPERFRLWTEMARRMVDRYFR